MRANPAAGPSRIATATARLSSDNRRWFSLQEHIIQTDDTPPVRGGRGGRQGVGRGDGRLNGVGADFHRERSLNEGCSLGDLVPIPPRSILIFEQNHVPDSDTRAARRESCKEQQGEQTEHLGIGGAAASEPGRGEWLLRTHRAGSPYPRRTPSTPH